MIFFNKASITDLEEKYVLDCLRTRNICGDNKYTKLVDEIFEKKFNLRGMLVTSCSTALDMTAILCDLKDGDEVICPSYTFVSTINAFVLRGAKPIFVDIDKRTLNIDANKIEEKISRRNRRDRMNLYGYSNGKTAFWPSRAKMLLRSMMRVAVSVSRVTSLPCPASSL